MFICSRKQHKILLHWITIALLSYSKTKCFMTAVFFFLSSEILTLI